MTTGLPPSTGEGNSFSELSLSPFPPPLTAFASGAAGMAVILAIVPPLGGWLRQKSRRKDTREEARETGQYLRAIFDGAPTAIIALDRNLSVRAWNAAAERIFGWRAEEVIGRPYPLFPQGNGGEEEWLQRLVGGGESIVDTELVRQRKDGTLVTVSVSTAPLIDGNGAITGAVGMFLDISERKRAELLLSGEKAVLEMIASGAPLAEILDSLCRTVEEQSPGSYCSLLLLDDEGTHLRHAAAPSLPDAYNRIIDGTRIGPAVGSCGSAAFTRHPTIAGDIATDPLWEKYKSLPLSFGLKACWSQPVVAGTERVLGTFAIYYDRPRVPDDTELRLLERAAGLAGIIVEYKKAEDAFRKLQREQQAILDTIPDLVWLKDRQSRFIIVNEAFGKACGLPPGELIGKSDFDIWPRDLAERYWQDDARVMASGERTRVEELLDDRFGGRKWIETIKMPIRDEFGEIIGTTGIARDIEVRKTAEKALRESEERFYQLFAQNSDAIILFRAATFDIIDGNPAASVLYGYSHEELLVLSPSLLMEPADFQKFSATVSREGVGEPFQLARARHRRKNGSCVTVAMRGKVMKLRDEEVLFCSIRDITEKIKLEKEMKAAQAKLIHVNKMTSLGTLVSGLAHEINNPNNFIAVNTAILTEAWRDAEPLLERSAREFGDFTLAGLPYAEMLETAPRLFAGLAKGSERVSAIVANLKNFAREDRSGLDGKVDVNRLVREATAMLGHHIHRRTHCYQIELHDGLPPVRGNAQQIEQVIINLVMNSLQALPDKGAGIRVSTEAEEDGKYVVIRVTDEGHGMCRAVLDRITEPFFTTRLDSGGTGLGLSICASIMKDHHGELEFASEPGRGTTATVRLSACRGKESPPLPGNEEETA